MRNVLAMACGLAFVSSLGARAQDDGPLLLRSPTISKTSGPSAVTAAMPAG